MPITPEQYKLTTAEASGGTAGQTAYNERIAALRAAEAPQQAPEKQTLELRDNFNFDLEGMSSSFSDIAKSITESNKGLSNLFPQNDTSIQAQADANKAMIRAQADQSRSQIELEGEAGQLREDKALDLLQLSPAAIRSNIEQFGVQSKQFHSSIANAITSLDAAETAALQSQDTSAAAQIRQQKMDFYTLQRQATQDSLTLMTNAFNLMLTGKQMQRQDKLDAQSQATNQANMLIAAYSGQDIKKLSPEIQQKFADAESALGLPLGTLSQQLMNKNVKYHVSKGDYTYFFDAGGNLVNRIATPTGSGSQSLDVEWNAFVNGNINKPSSKNAGAVNAELLKLQSDALGNLVWQARQSLSAKITRSQEQPLTPPELAEVKDSTIDNITQALIDRGLAPKYLDLNYTPVSVNDELKSRLRQLVESVVDTYISDTFIYNTVANAGNPQFNLFSGLDTEGGASNSGFQVIETD